VLAGIQTDPEGAGFEKITIKPHIIRDIATVSAAVKTLRGRIAVSWRKEMADRLYLMLVREFTLISQFLENSGAIVPIPNSAYQHET